MPPCRPAAYRSEMLIQYTDRVKWEGEWSEERDAVGARERGEGWGGGGGGGVSVCWGGVGWGGRWL